MRLDTRSVTTLSSKLLVKEIHYGSEELLDIPSQIIKTYQDDNE
jgi:hypothetical protein